MNEINEIELQKLELEKKVLSYLGLAQRGRNALSGEFAVEKGVKSFDAQLVLVAGDASDNTKKMFRNMCEFYEVPLYIVADKNRLGHAMGFEYRASAAITDEGLANAAIKKLEELAKL